MYGSLHQFSISSMLLLAVITVALDTALYTALDTALDTAVKTVLISHHLVLSACLITHSPLISCPHGLLSSCPLVLLYCRPLVRLSTAPAGVVAHPRGRSSDRTQFASRATRYPEHTR